MVPFSFFIDGSIFVDCSLHFPEYLFGSFSYLSTPVGHHFEVGPHPFLVKLDPLIPQLGPLVSPWKLPPPQPVLVKLAAAN